MIKENNIKMTTTINEIINEKPKDFQTTLIKTCEEMITQQMSIINLNIIKIIKVTLEEQRVTPQLLTPSNQQQDINQQPNILQDISPSTPGNTQPITQIIESRKSAKNLKFICLLCFIGHARNKCDSEPQPRQPRNPSANRLM